MAASVGNRFVGHLPLQIVTPENMPDFVDQPRSGLAGFLAQRRQPPILLIGGGSDGDLSYTADRLAFEKATSVDPQ